MRGKDCAPGCSACARLHELDRKIQPILAGIRRATDDLIRARIRWERAWCELRDGPLRRVLDPERVRCLALTLVRHEAVIDSCERFCAEEAPRLRKLETEEARLRADHRVGDARSHQRELAFSEVA